MGKKTAKKGKEMALSGHLKELRNRLIICVVCFLVAFLVSLSFAADIVELLTDIGRAYGYQYVYIAPQELLMEHFSVALIAGLCVVFPVLAYQVWAFVRPGLSRKENILFVLAALFGLAFFIVGVLFAYKIMLPFMLEFLIGIRTGTDIVASISIQSYISFLITIFLIFGVVFELPVISVLLTQMSLVKVAWMKKGRRVVIVLIFLLAGFITPPDIISQVMVAVPMIALYELSILICTILLKFRKKKAEQEEETEDEDDSEDDADEEETED